MLNNKAGPSGETWLDKKQVALDCKLNNVVCLSATTQKCVIYNSQYNMVFTEVQNNKVKSMNRSTYIGSEEEWQQEDKSLEHPRHKALWNMVNHIGQSQR